MQSAAQGIYKLLQTPPQRVAESLAMHVAWPRAGLVRRPGDFFQDGAPAARQPFGRKIKYLISEDFLPGIRIAIQVYESAVLQPAPCFHPPPLVILGALTGAHFFCLARCGFERVVPGVAGVEPTPRGLTCQSA